jgi:Carboxypeptidase regulatory-like domain
MKILKLAFLLLIMSNCGRAQTNSQGALVGTVTDPTGAVVPNVSVTATNLATGIQTQTTTGAEGDYRFSFLSPGNYTVTLEKDGFNKAEIHDIVVEVGTTIRSDLRLHVGQLNQEVVVGSSVATINTEDASLGDVIGSEAISHLPLNGREFLQLAALEPGAVSGNPKRGVHGSKGVDVSFNGARVGYNSYYINGAANTDPLYNQMQSSPALDAVSEFRVMTNMYSAQYGRAGGAIVAILTKQGENRFHGSAYEYHRNKALDALPYFYTGKRRDLSNYLFNQYGGTLGGPIIKKKTFFFFSTEFFHQAKPGQQIVTFAPTDLERQGDFTKTINPYTGQPVQLMDPYTHQPIPGNILPASLINPVGKKLMSLWPSPNFSGDPFLNLHLFRGGLYTQKKYLGRVDHRFSARDSITGTFDYNNYDNVSPGMNVWGDKTSVDHNRTWAGTWTHVFTPRLVNDFKGSFAWFQSGSQFTLNGKNYCVSWGFDPTTNTVPGTCRILMYTIGYQRYDIGNDGDFKHHNNSFYAKNNLVWVKGNHTVAFGGEFTRDMFNWQYDSGSTAYYFGLLDGYPGYESYYGMTGTVFGDLLTAIPNLTYFGLGGTEGPTNMNFVRNVIGGYVQDDWKVNPRLTLNLGVRYDYEQPFAESDNLFMTLDFNTGLPRYAQGVPQNLLAPIRFKYETGGPNRPYEPYATNFSPRVGFALRPFGNNNTVLRGGYGIFYTTENAFTTMYGSWVSPFQGLVNTYPRAFFWPDKQDHITTVDQPPYGLDFARGTSPGYFLPNTPYYPTGYVQQWNLTVGRDLGHRWGTEVGYVGSRGVNLMGQTTTQTYSNSLYQQAVANGFSNFGLRQKGFSSHYDALQTTVRKEASHGFNMLMAYTWSHAFAQSSNDDTLENLLTDVTVQGTISRKLWSQADFDVRHRLSVAGGYELPFGHGKLLGSHWNPWLQNALGGWRSNFIYALQSGVPFTVYTSALRFPDRICNGNLPAGQRTPSHWYDYTCFANHPPTTYVDPATGMTSMINLQGNSRPNIITGPRTNNFDFGMEKYFTIREGYTLQIRAEAFNLLNHPNLLTPNGNYFFNSASGASITSARDGRDIQVAARFSF